MRGILLTTSLLVMLLFYFNNCQAQTTYTTTSNKAIKFYEEGRTFFKYLRYNEAEMSLKKAISTDKEFIEPYIVLAKLYWDIDSLQLAIQTYHLGLSLDPAFYPQGFLFKANLEIKTGQYSEAEFSFNKLIQFENKSQKLIRLGKVGLTKVRFALQLKQNPVKFKPVLLDTTVNSADDEYWPSISADEQTLVITRLINSSLQEGRKVNEDFYMSTFKENNWTLASNLGAPLNTYDNEGAQSLSANGRFMVYTVCNRRGVIGRCDLYSSRKKGTVWSEPVNLGKPINSTAKETQPSVSSDGRTIYFASNRSGGKGGLDIWVSSQGTDGRWSTPINLGDSINTRGNESSPFIHHDNNTIYFSSDTHLGMGGFDLFYSRRNPDGNWGTSKNLGYPINTHKDEIGLIINAKGDKAYYSSNINPLRGRDIYQFELYEEVRPMEVSYLMGKVYNRNNRMVLKADFELYDLSNGDLINKSFSDMYSGEFLICIPANKNYMLNVSKKGYLFFSENFSMKGVHHFDKPFYKDVPLQPIESGKKIILKNIFYETDSYQLKEESKTELNKIVQFLKINPTVKIEISGHTDNIGTPEYNLKLSENRAKEVVGYLKHSGIRTERLFSEGYGESKPVDSNNTKEGRGVNRRTELKILE